MISKMLRRCWTHLLITFADNYTAEGFEKTPKKFLLPENLQELESGHKREMTICNLFANQSLSINEIVRVLDSSPHQVIPVLIENGLIKERRKKRKRQPSSETTSPGSLSILPKEDLHEGDSEGMQTAPHESSTAASPQAVSAVSGNRRTA